MPLSAATLQHEKATFLKKFDLKPKQAGWLCKSLRDAMRASARRGHLYRPGMSQAQRNCVRRGWSQELERLAWLYAANGPTFATQAQFETDLMALRAFMNTNYGDYFEVVPVNGYPPACCPVDRRILVIARAIGSEAKWTHLDTPNAYHDKLRLLRTASARFAVQPISLAQWELCAFNHI